MYRTLTAIAIVATMIGSISAGQGQPAPKKADVIRQLHSDFEEARARLQKDDPGKETRAAHRRIIEGIDKLLDDQDPDKSPPKPMQPPTGDNVTPREKQVVPKAPQPQPMSLRTPGAKSVPEVRPAPEGNGKLLPLPKMDGPWHPLRNLPREAMDAVGRERFPRGYEELLRAYYRSLAAGRSDD